MEEEGAKSPEVAIAVEDDLRALQNRPKNAEGQLAGLKRGRIVEKQRAAEPARQGLGGEAPRRARRPSRPTTAWRS